MITESETFHMEQLISAPDTASIAECDTDGHRDGSTAASAMSGLETPSDPAAIITEATSPALTLSTQDFGLRAQDSGLLQPVSDIPAYLKTRKPTPDYRSEPALFATLPITVKRKVRELTAAFNTVAARVKAGHSVQQSLRTPNSALRVPLKTLRDLYDRWAAERDWLILVNRSQCNSLWRSSRDRIGLPVAFLAFCAQRFSEFSNEYGCRQAIISIQRQWRTGRNPNGEAEPIKGYEQGWEERARKLIPAGWHYSNILRQIKKSGRFTKAIRAFSHEGEAAAREHLPQVLSTRTCLPHLRAVGKLELRFLEKITFDDVRTDWLVFNEATGRAEELWLLVARDEATAMVLGFVMHPATVREDGTQSHLGIAQMKQLAGWLLERYPLPPYTVTWRVERGTATLSEAIRLALGELFGDRIIVSYTSMIGSNASPAGYAEKKKGNSRGKASHESHNRLFHTQGSYIPGQTGSHYAIRPADLNARVKECAAIWELRQKLPAHLQGQEQYPLLTLAKAKEHLYRICRDQNDRDDHALEGFEDVIETYDAANDRWQIVNSLPSPDSGLRTQDSGLRTRKEKPIERAARLARGYHWEPVSPEILTAFYEHTQKFVPIAEDGEVQFQHEGKLITYCPPPGFLPSAICHLPATGRDRVRKVLAYFNSDDPYYLHLTTGKGEILGTWIRRDLAAADDHEALAAAFRYTHHARETARAAANELAAPKRAGLEAMRAHNHELLAQAGDGRSGSEFIQLADAPGDPAISPIRPISPISPIARALTSVPITRKAIKAEAKQRAEEAGHARATLLKAADQF